MAIVPAAAQSLAILRYLAQQAEPVPAAAICRDVRLPRSTTYHLLDTLIADGFVMHLPEERRYGLGLSSYELASGYSRQAPLQRLARLPLAGLVDRTGHNAHLAVLHGREVIYVIEERAPGRPPLVTDVGVRLPAHLTPSCRPPRCGRCSRTPRRSCSATSWAPAPCRSCAGCWPRPGGSATPTRRAR